MTMDDYLDARPVSDPLGLFDCDVPVDGSIASSSPSMPTHPTVPQPRSGSRHGRSAERERLDPTPRLPEDGVVEAAAEMWSRTDLRPADVDIAELYDGFTFLTFAWLEALGFCGDGEAGPFVEGASRIALDGELPLNTYGGQLSAGRMHGYWVLHEACVQLRGRGPAPARSLVSPRWPSSRTGVDRSPAACSSRCADFKRRSGAETSVPRRPPSEQQAQCLGGKVEVLVDALNPVLAPVDERVSRSKGGRGKRSAVANLRVEQQMRTTLRTHPHLLDALEGALGTYHPGTAEHAARAQSRSCSAGS